MEVHIKIIMKLQYTHPSIYERNSFDENCS
jgi:hypothetical protein